MVFRDRCSSRLIRLSDQPWTWKARRTRAIVSTDFIPPPSAQRIERMVAEQTNEGGQNWTPMTPPRGSILHADSQPRRGRLARAVLWLEALHRGPRIDQRPID